jgi:hypothetical protein
LPRERIEVIDPNTPFLEPPSLPTACTITRRRGIVTGIGLIQGREAVICIQRCNGQRRQLLSNNSKASTHKKLRKKIVYHAYIWSTPAAQIYHIKQIFSQTESTSDAFSTMKHACQRWASPKSQWSWALAQQAARMYQLWRMKMSLCASAAPSFLLGRPW